MKLKHTQPDRGLFKKLAGKMRAFSMAEVLIALALIGVLVMILFPVLQKTKPDELETLHKKGQYIMEHIVTDLVYDEDIYPNTITTKGLASIGEVIVEGKKYGDPNADKSTEKAKTKFCELFASRLNLYPGSTIKCLPDTKTVRSVEGIDWYLPISNFDGSNGSNYGIIKFDVNGTKGPNCKYDKNTCPHPDTFVYYIQPDGKIIQETPDPSLLRYNIIINVKNGSAVATCNSGSCYGLKPGSYDVQLHPSFGYSCKPWVKKSVYLSSSDYVEEVECTKTGEEDPSAKKGTIHIVKQGEVNESMAVADGYVFLRDRAINFTNCKVSGSIQTCEAYVDANVDVDYQLYGSPYKDVNVASAGTKSGTLTAEGQTIEMSIRFNWDQTSDPFKKYNVQIVRYADPECSSGATIKYWLGSGGTYKQLTIPGENSFSVNNGSSVAIERGLSPVDPSTGLACKLSYSGPGSVSGDNFYTKVNGADLTVFVRLYKGNSKEAAPEQETYDVKVNVVCEDGSNSCGGVTGNGQYVKGSSATVTVNAEKGYKIKENGGTKWSTTVTSDYEKTIIIASDSYCVNVSKNGNGKILGPDGKELTSGKFCNVPGTYTFTAVPDAGYKSDWAKDSWKVTLKDKDVSLSCTFTKEEEKTYCLNVPMFEDNKVPCEASKCGTAKLVGDASDTKSFSPTVSEQCGLRNGEYTLTVTPTSDYGINPKSYKIVIDNSSTTFNLHFYKPIIIKFIIENSSYGKIVDGNKRVTSLDFPVEKLTAVDLPEVESTVPYEFLKWRCADEIDYEVGTKGAFERAVTCRAIFSKENRSIKLTHSSNFEIETTSYTVSSSHQLIGINKLFMAIENYQDNDWFALPINISWNVQDPNSYDAYWEYKILTGSGNSLTNADLCLTTSFTSNICMPSGSSFPLRAGNTAAASSGSQDYYLRFRGNSYGEDGLALFVCYKYKAGTSTPHGYANKDLVGSPSLSDNRQCSSYFIKPSL